MKRPPALAEAKLGEFQRAIERVDSAIARRLELGSRGLNLGSAYETRARIAIWMRDEPAFRAAAQACACEYGQGRGGSSFAGKYEALRAEARQAGLSTTSDLPAAIPVDTITTALTRLSEDGPFEGRAALALDRLIREAGAEAGALYRATGGKLLACASCGSVALSEYAQGLATITLGRDDDANTSVESCEPGTDGRRWFPAALGFYEHGRYVRTGVAVLCFHDQQPRGLPLPLVEAVARMLREA